MLVLGTAEGHCSTTSILGAALIGENPIISTFTANPSGTDFSLELSSGINLGQGGLGFSDGTIQFSGDGAASTTTALPTQAIPLSLGPCLSGSTVTITITGSRHLGIFFSGHAGKPTTPAASVTLAVLIDGAPLPEFSGAGVAYLNAGPGSGEVNSFSLLTRSRYSPGEHRVCLQAATSSATGFIDGTSKGTNFGAFEVR